MHKYRPSKKYFYIGVTTFLVVMAVLAVILILFFFREILGIIGWAIDLFSPFIYGFVFAFLMNPITKKLEQFYRFIFKTKYQSLKLAYKNCEHPHENISEANLYKFTKIEKKYLRFNAISRAICIIATLIIVAAAITGIMLMLVPELTKSVSGIVANFPSYITNFRTWLGEVFIDFPEVTNTITNAVNEAFSYARTFIMSEGFISGVTNSALGVVASVVNIFLGLVIAIYFLASKEKFLAQLKKIVYALFKKNKANRIILVGVETNRVFGGFIIGKIIDSAIIMVLCFIVMAIVNMPYYTLISVIIGITNIIPFIGPIIGAIPSAVLIFMVDPVQCLFFIAWVLILQQLDGNIIGPRVLAGATGLSGFWVLFSITIFSGLFGILGAFIGVPVFTLVYTAIKLFIERKLHKRKMSRDTKTYYGDGIIYKSDAEPDIVQHNIVEPTLITDKEREEAKMAQKLAKKKAKKRFK